MKPRCELPRLSTSASIVVTDIVMFNMGGRELATHLTRLHPHAKVLLCRGYPDSALRQSGFWPKTEVLQKPFSLKSLASNPTLLKNNSSISDTHRR